jgi:hypothetical protein
MRPKWLPSAFALWGLAWVVVMVVALVVAFGGCVLAYGEHSSAQMTTHRAPVFKVDLSPDEPASQASAALP